MRILQLVSDWKWTGPAEPMLVLMEALRSRGHLVDLVCPEPPSGSNRSLWQEACYRRLDPVHAIKAERSALRAGDRREVEAVAAWLASDISGSPYQIVHCWHSRDHVLAARALGRLNTRPHSTDSTRIVRSLPHSRVLRAWPWNRWLFGRGCDGLVCVSEAAREGAAKLRKGRLSAATTGAVRLDELRLERSRSAIRQELGIDEQTVLIGVVARMQPYRRFDLLLEALGYLIRDRPQVKLVIVGRGTRSDEVVVRPMRELGLESHVVLAGYRVEDYAEVLSAMDLFTYLVPGSDGTCRALLQAAALGLPLVGSRRGAIPEIISNGQTGMIVTEDSPALASAWKTLVDDPERRRAMGHAAARDARERFRPETHAAWMERFYEEVIVSSASSSGEESPTRSR